MQEGQGVEEEETEVEGAHAEEAADKAQEDSEGASGDRG